MQIIQFHKYSLGALAMLALAGCSTSSGKYPSLAVRDAERVSGSFPVAADNGPPPAPAQTQANILDSLPEQLALAQSAHAQFVGMSGAAERLAQAARGSTPDSNIWAEAQIALAEMEGQRSQSAVALGTLDLYYADATLGFTQREQIDAVRAQVIDLVQQEDAVLARLRAQMAN